VRAGCHRAEAFQRFATERDATHAWREVDDAKDLDRLRRATALATARAAPGAVATGLPAAGSGATVGTTAWRLAAHVASTESAAEAAANRLRQDRGARSATAAKPVSVPIVMTTVMPGAMASSTMTQISRACRGGGSNAVFDIG